MTDPNPMDMELTVSELMRESSENAANKGWWETEEDRSVGTKLALMHSEISEALEEWRSNRPLDEIYYESAPHHPGVDSLKPCGFTVEIADLLIRVFDFCGHKRLPLSRALREKLAYNRTRPHRHGGKKA